VLGRSALGRLTAGVIALMAIVPASAHAGIKVTFDPAGNGDLVIQADYSDYVNKLALVTENPSGTSPDLVIGDVTAGIANPIPSICFRVDLTIIRCQQSMVGQININLGRGNDTLNAKGIEQLAAFTMQQYLTAHLGPGKDVAEGAPAANVIFGGPGRDLIMGGPFGDKLFGGAQNDFLVGLGGNDLLQCGNGPHDLFNDGPGKDLVNVGTCEVRVHTKF
jgi:Ca2+-binding RTX toxin-like protein